MTVTATVIRKYLPNWNGKAHLYKLSEPITVIDAWDPAVGEKFTFETKYVIVSAANVSIPGYGGGGPETYIFPADVSGNVMTWTELPGSFRGGMDHKAAIEQAGWELNNG